MKITFNFKLWCITSCLVGVNVFNSESRCLTSISKKLLSEYLVLSVRKRVENFLRKCQAGYAKENFVLIPASRILELKSLLRKYCRKAVAGKVL